jgi:hypothetical protein
MKKYSESVLEYKNSFKNTQDLVSNTDKLFEDKYFGDEKANKKFFPPFIPGQIYSFYYATDSKVNEKRKFINRNPIVLCLDSYKSKKDGIILKGIDLITVPPLRKIEIISKVFDNFNNTITKNYDAYSKGGNIEPLPLNASFLERFMAGTGYNGSVFGFKANFIQKIKIVDLEDWFKLPYLRFSMIEGLQTQGIYKEYESKLI